MFRTATAFLAGAVIGAILAVSLSHYRPLTMGGSLSDESMLPLPARGAREDGGEPVAPHLGSHEDRTNFHLMAVALSESELESRIVQIAGHPDRTERHYVGQVLLSRLAELDPERALILARRNGFGAEIAAQLYVDWAKADVAAALSALRTEADVGIARSAAVMLAALLGGDAAALLDVLDALPPGIDPLDVQVGVLVERAGHDITGALRDAGNFESPLHSQKALRRLATEVAAKDPDAAIAASAAIEDPAMQKLFRAALLSDWSLNDPDAVFTYIESLDSGDPEYGGYLMAAGRNLALHDPERLLSMTSQGPDRASSHLARSALTEMSKADPDKAIAHAVDMPIGRERDEMLAAVAEGYAEYDVIAAVEWVRTLQPKPHGVMRSLLSHIAATDIDYALDIALATETGPERWESLQSVAMATVFGNADKEHLASRLLAIEDATTKDQALQSLTSMWSQSDAASAIDWLSRNIDQVPTDSLRNMARQLGEREPELAAGLADRLPADIRGEWIQQVATGYARYDPAGAMTWLTRYQGDPAYDGAVARVAQVTAQYDPVAVGRTVSQNPDAAHAPQLAAAAARHWADSDPQRAAAWAASLTGGEARKVAISTVAGQWASADSESAADWALQLPRGDARDDALISVISQIAYYEPPDDALINAIDDSLARQQAALNAAYRLVRTDAAAAQKMLDRFVTDPSLQRQFEQRRSRLSLN